MPNNLVDGCLDFGVIKVDNDDHPHFRNYLRCSTISGSSIHKIINHNSTAYYRKLVETKLCLETQIAKTEPNTSGVLNFARGNAVENWLKIDYKKWYKEDAPYGIFDSKNNLSCHPDMIGERIIEVKATKYKHGGETLITHEHLLKFMQTENQTLIKGIWQVVYYHVCYLTLIPNLKEPWLLISENVGADAFVVKIEGDALAYLMNEIKIAIQRFNRNLRNLIVNQNSNTDYKPFKDLELLTFQIQRYKSSPEYLLYLANVKVLQLQKETMPNDLIFYDPESHKAFFRKPLNFKTSGGKEKSLKNILYFNYE